MAQSFFLLSYFDTTDNKRKYYLNRTSFFSIEAAEQEFMRIDRDRIKHEKFKSFKYSHRIKWAIETGRNIVIKKLN